MQKNKRIESDPLKDIRVEAVTEAIKLLDAKGKRVNSRTVAYAANEIRPESKLTFHLIQHHEHLRGPIRDYNDKESNLRKCLEASKSISVPLQIAASFPKFNQSKNVLVKEKLVNDFDGYREKFIKDFSNSTYGQKVMSNARVKGPFILMFEAHRELENIEHCFSILGSQEFCVKVRTSSAMSFQSYIRLFLYWLKDKGLMLWPFFPEDYFLKVGELYAADEFINAPFFADIMAYKEKDKRFIAKSALFLYLSVNVKAIEQISEEELSDYEKRVESHYSPIKETRVKQRHNLRKMLAFYNGDIKTVFQKKKETRDSKKTPNYVLEYNLTGRHESLQEALHDANKYLERKHKIDRVVRSTLAQIKSQIGKYLDFLISLEGFSYSNKSLNRIFDYPDSENTFQEYVILHPDIKAKGELLNTIFEMYHAIKKGEVFPKINLPVIPRGYTRNIRSAITDEVYDIIVDVILNDPPQSSYYWTPSRANLDWWPHKSIYPALPLMVYLHLIIPLRGEQIRSLDAQNFLIQDMHKKIIGFYVNTDKNKNRKEKFIVPNLWGDELKIFEDYLAWHSEYFPNARKYNYKGEENQTHDSFIPLFMARNETTPIQQYAHMNYWKRVLVKAQLSLIDEYGDEYQDSLVEMKNGAERIKSPRELDDKDDIFLSRFVSAKYDIHSLRVTGATRYIKMGFPVNLVKKLTGHEGINTLFNIYVDLDTAKTAERINGADLPSLVESTQETSSFVKKVFGTVSDVETVISKMRDNGLFFLERITNEKLELDDMSMPLSWKSFSYGICTRAQCPAGVENKCSLCPFLATGRPFIAGIALQAELKFMRMAWIANQIHNNRKNGKADQNPPLRRELKIHSEELAGWIEIINKVEVDNSPGHNDNLPVKSDANLVTYGSSSMLEGYSIIYAKAKALNYSDHDTQVMQDRMANAVQQMILKGEIPVPSQNVLEDQTALIEWFIEKSGATLSAQDTACNLLTTC